MQSRPPAIGSTFFVLRIIYNGIRGEKNTRKIEKYVRILLKSSTYRFWNSEVRQSEANFKFVLFFSSDSLGLLIR